MAPLCNVDKYNMIFISVRISSNRGRNVNLQKIFKFVEDANNFKKLAEVTENFAKFQKFANNLTKFVGLANNFHKGRRSCEQFWKVCGS